MRLQKRTIIIIVVTILIVLSGISVYYLYISGYLSPQENLLHETQIDKQKEDKIGQNTCLGDDEIVDYEIKKQKNSSDLATIFVRNKITNQISSDFQINIISANHYHPLEIHQCGVYASRSFNYDYSQKKALPNYRAEIWRYTFDGKKERLLLLGNLAEDEYRSVFSNDFRVDPLEHYIVLLKGYFSSPDYALVIKDLKTLEDIFVLPMTEIEKQNKEIIGNLELDSWTRNGRYFWVATHYGAVSLGFIRIDAQNWTFDIFQAPENILGGDALNIENGYITVHPGNVWYGVEEIELEEKAKRRKEGIGTELYIYNLFTGERYFITKIDEPLWFFKPRWISENELQYELPNGEKKIYKIN